MATEKTMAPVHPGELLREEFLEPMGITAYRLAKDIGVPEQRIGSIVREQRGISADTALRLSRYFGMSENYWMNAQAHYERELVKDEMGDDIERIRPLASA
ncbi:MAG: HigA family addiction module antitoxin [Rubrobacteraceae bacterium]